MTPILADRIKGVPLTRTQQKIADYFLQNPERIGGLSSLEAAREIGVSDASIIRFSRAIGFEGFADLKEHIYDTLVKDAYSGLSLSDRMSQSSTQYPSADNYSQFLALMQENLEDSLRRNSPEELRRTAELLSGADSRIIIGLRGCRGAAMQFARLLSFMLPNVTCLIDGESTSLTAVHDIREKSVVLMFVLARYYKVDRDYLRLAKEKRASVCLVTDNVASPLSEYADICLLAGTRHMSFFNSIVGIDAVGEYLLTLVGRMTEFQDRIRIRDELTREQRL